MSRSLLSTMCRQCRARYRPSSSRRIHTSAILQEEQDPYSVFDEAFKRPTPRFQPRAMQQPSAQMEQLAQNARGEAATRPQAGAASDEPYHLNVYAHKHNTHITFTEPSRDVILSYSAGNIGLRKGQRGSFDAAYQLSTYTMRKMAEKNWKIGGKKSSQPPVTLNDERVRQRGIEVVMRGYGSGREAFQKAVLGAEGKIIKGMIKRVTDSTRLKFGGTRSPAFRRLG